MQMYTGTESFKKRNTKMLYLFAYDMKMEEKCLNNNLSQYCSQILADA